MPYQPKEGMKIARLLMVLSSISPIFIIWAIQGNKLIPDIYFISFCALMVFVPILALCVRIRTAKKRRDRREITISKAEDHREHLLVYLFAMLLPFYTADFSTWRDLFAAVTALGFIIFLFWHLNLHYMNLLFAAMRYRVFTIYPSQDDNPFNGKISQVLISRRMALVPGEKITAYRLSDTVFFEEE